MDGISDREGVVNAVVCLFCTGGLMAEDLTLFVSVIQYQRKKCFDTFMIF